MEGVHAPGHNIESKEWEKFIPLDKYWIIRVGSLDIINGNNDIVEFLKDRPHLGGDVLATKKAAETWNTGGPVKVLEAGTLYRILQFYSWKNGLNKKFDYELTLKNRIDNREISQDPNIVNLPLEELAKLDKGTSQWVTAALLSGDTGQVENPEYHIALTYEAIKHWREQRSKGLRWEARYDETIKRQVETFLKLLKGERPDYVAIQPDEYLFARTFGYMTAEEGKSQWPRLQGHETPRIDEMEKVIELAQSGGIIDSKDHRVVQAIAMWGKVNKKELIFSETSRIAVNKTWPQFWEFLDSVTKK